MIAAAAFAAGVWAALVALVVGLCRAAGKERRRDERVDAELEAMANATACDCPRCTARRQATT